jgi:molybdopterin/thiamine biosynthesis adenylyltransferase
LPRASRGKAEQPANLSSRLPQFVGGPGDAAAVLRDLRVACVGAGSVGGRIACHLARLGIFELWLIDPKCFKAESVLTHESEPAAAGHSKAEYTGSLCKAISRRTLIFTYRGKVQDLPMDIFAGLDLVIMAPDNLAAEIEVGQRCLHFGVPLIHASLFGETLTAQVRFFTNAKAVGPCPACSFGETERRQAFDETQFSCEGAVNGRAVSTGTEQPTRSISSLCSTSSDLAINQAIRHFLRLGDPVGNTIIEYCGYTNQIITSPLKRNPDCPCDHIRITVASSHRDLALCTPAGLARAFGFSTADKSLTIAVEGSSWLLRGSCCCALPAQRLRLIPCGAKVAGRCPRCRSTIQVMPFHAHRSVPFSLLGKGARKTLGDSAAQAASRVFLRNARRATLIRNPGAASGIP